MALGSIPTTKIIRAGYKSKSWRLMPVIPATQEAEIRRIEVRSQPGK
jgi:hypothetical protein